MYLNYRIRDGIWRSEGIFSFEKYRECFSPFARLHTNFHSVARDSSAVNLNFHADEIDVWVRGWWVWRKKNCILHINSPFKYTRTHMNHVCNIPSSGCVHIGIIKEFFITFIQLPLLSILWNCKLCIFIQYFSLC